MPSDEIFYLGLHSRRDHERIDALVRGLEVRGVSVWLDTMLNPGTNFQQVIYDALNQAAGMLFFLSPASLGSDTIQQQLELIRQARQDDMLVIVMEAGLSLPAELDGAAQVDISGQRTPAAVAAIVQAIDALPHRMTLGECFTEEQAWQFADLMAQRNRGTRRTTPAAVPNSIFIVHGHDHALRDTVNTYLQGLGIETVILSEAQNSTESLFQKFLRFSEDVEFAVVLITADDYGAARRQYDAPGVADRALQFRARQNVVLELGFFYGYLGWEHVFVLLKPAPEVFPNFELPSDLAGILFDQVDPAGDWQSKLAQRLRDAGFALREG